MKTIYSNTSRNLLTLIFLLFSMALAMAQESGAHPLVGTWTFSQGPSFARMPSDVKMHLDSIPQLKSQILGSYTGRTISFAPNGDFVQSMPNGTKVPGKWAIQGNILFITGPNGNVLRQSIGELKDNRLVLLMPTNGEARTIFPELYYTKTSL